MLILPSTRRGWAGRPRFVYAALLDYEEPNHAPYLYGAYKFDLATGACREQVWGAKGRFQGGEPLFAPRPGSTREDDGWVLCLVNDKVLRRTELRVYDAADFGAPGGGAAPVATVVCPRRLVPLGTHGLWLGKDEVDSVVND